MILLRTDYLQSGIFGNLTNDDGSFSIYSLEHAFPVVPDISQISQNYAPAVPAGEYNCVRGMHQLEGMVEPFETFEITNVPGHTGILFHSGNVNADSSGCVLIGMSLIHGIEILQSKAAFAAFMAIMENIQSFLLTVK